MAINQQITALPDAPNRLDRDNFATDMHAFFIGMQAMTVELEMFRGEANTTAAGVNTDVTAAVTARTAAQTAQTAAEAAQTAAETVAGASTWSYAVPYNLNDAVSGADGHIYKSLTGNSGNCPHGFNRITRVGATNHWIRGQITDPDPSGKTFTLKVKMWRETLTGEISLVIEEGSGDYQIMVYDSQPVTQTIAEYSTTATFPAGSDANVRVRINPNDNDGPDGDTFGVHSVFLYDHADPDTNLLTGNGTWQKDLTGWDATNCTISSIAASVATWVKISGGNEIPIGGTYIDAVTDADPALKLGYGIWQLIGRGQALVGIDSGDGDFNTIGRTGGGKTARLSETHLPPLWHPHGAMGAGLMGGGVGSPQGAIIHRFIGGGNRTPFSVMSPYRVVAIWERTA